MKTLYFRSLFLAALLPLSSCSQEEPAVSQTEPVTDISEFLGHWSFDIEGGGVGWLDVRQEDNYIDADLLWWGGSVLPVANIFLAGDGVLHVSRIANRRKGPADDPDARVHTVTNWIEARVDREKISGYYMTPRASGIGVDSTWLEGVKLPDVTPAPDLAALRYGEPVELFNGVDLTGWVLINENHVNGWTVIDGALVNDVRQKPGEPRIRYGNLRTTDNFGDFNLTLEVNVPEGSNSGVYLRGMYEIQVLDSYGRPPTDHTMGSVYSRVAPAEAAERPAGVWQTMDITLANRHVTVILNGIKIIDNQPVYGPTGGAIQSNIFAPGPIFLQGDHGPVSYRNMVLTPIL